MNPSSSFDRETLQQFLANAFAVQESKISSQSLSAIVNVQRSVASGKLDLNGALHHLVESARNVANADGAAIGLMEENHITYLAGSGYSAGFVGRRVTASLTGSSTGRTSREILRVENAQTDTRIEAAICRQFGANSLLILPIYHDHAVAGVLDILFNEAHVFDEPEVCTYRLMAEQIEAAMFPAVPLQPQNGMSPPFFEPTSEPTPEPAPEPTPQVFEQYAAPLDEDEYVAPPQFWMGESSEPSFFERCAATLSAARELPAVRKLVGFAETFARRTIERAKNTSMSSPFFEPTSEPTPEPTPEPQVFEQYAAPLDEDEYVAPKQFWMGESSEPSFFERCAATLSAARELPVVRKLVGFAETFAHRAIERARNTSWRGSWANLGLAAVVLVFCIWIVKGNRKPLPALESSAVPSAAAIDPQSILSKPLPGESTAAVPSAPTAGTEPRHTTTDLRRVRVSPREVDYVGEDVTMRIFTDPPRTSRTRPPQGRVTHIGSDVTVRSFESSQPSARIATR
jgi:hypothetical protein